MLNLLFRDVLYKRCTLCIFNRRVSLSCTRLLSSSKRPWEHFESKYDEKKDSDDNKKMIKVWTGVGLFASAAVTIIYLFDKQKTRLVEKRVTQRNLSIGKPAIGGPFSLRSLNNKTVTDEDFRGKWVLLYFGFTNCPDICPEELEKLSKVHAELKRSGYSSVPVFVSVDPERDTPKKIADYLKEFHEDFVGLTGTMDEVTKVVKTFKVYFNKGPKDEEGDYIVDHSIICYLLNPNGDFVEYFGQNKTAADMVKTIKQYISFGINQKF